MSLLESLNLLSAFLWIARISSRMDRGYFILTSNFFPDGFTNEGMLAGIVLAVVDIGFALVRLGNVITGPFDGKGDGTFVTFIALSPL